MIRTHLAEADRLRAIEGQAGLDAASEGAWIDLAYPTREEKDQVGGIIGAAIPTREEMAEIEASSRIYTDGDAAVMTVPVLISAEKAYPESSQITFVLTPRHLVTVRYAEPMSFAKFASSAQHSPKICDSAQAAFAGLVDAIADRIADLLEEVGRELDTFSRAVFTTDAEPAARDFKKQMQHLGRNGEIVAKADESLVGLSRAIHFARDLEHVRTGKGPAHKLRTVAQDVEVLVEHAAFLSNKINFLLDALLGMINIEQNAIIKIFSVVAVVFLPPTLIASIYGMNFEHMPELGWLLAYPAALIAMVASIAVTWLYFKRKGWI
jgi:magnesium transporter